MISTPLTWSIRKTKPRYVLFGHVHQPLQSRVRIGTTECINVGHFRARGLPYVLQWGRPGRPATSGASLA